MTNYIDASVFNDFSIVDFLARLGHHPVRKTGRDHFYHSMLRETQKRTPSFTVWDAGNVWKDWGGPNVSGIDKGGIIQLGMAYWPELSFVEVLNKMHEVCNMDTALIPEYKKPKIYPPDPQMGTFEWELISTKELGTNFVLTKYLHSRGLFDVAKNQGVKEVYYKRKNNHGDIKPFFAIGWQNELNSWEYSNPKGFKSCIGPKGISLIPGSESHVAVFEGYMDFLTWKKVEPEKTSTAIVLNAITLLGRAIDRLKNFQSVDIFCDNDDPGRNCTSKIIEEIPWAVDRSYQYKGFKDFNDKLKAGLMAEVNSANLVSTGLKR